MGREQRNSQPNQKPPAQHSASLRNDESLDIRHLRSQCHAYPNLLGPLGDGKHHHAIDAHCTEQESNSRKDAEQKQRVALLGDRFVHEISQIDAVE